MVQDVLCAVDGTPVLGWDLDAVCDIIKGEEGTPVVLEFRRFVIIVICVIFFVLSSSVSREMILSSRLWTGP